VALLSGRSAPSRWVPAIGDRARRRRRLARASRRLRTASRSSSVRRD